MEICVIGAGPRGIAAAKCLRDEGFTRVTVYDRGEVVGGNWVFDATSGHASVYETTRSISSKKFSQYADFPMPAHYPHYPSHEELAAYFQAYARHFRLEPLLRLSTAVLHCTRTADGRWAVTTECDRVQTTHVFDQLAVANGHHWQPRWPSYPGAVAGEYFHAHHYRRAAPFAGKRVLVVGGGNSGCDIAVALAGVAASVDASWRRGYCIAPRFVLGLPADAFVQSGTASRAPGPGGTWTDRAFMGFMRWRNARSGLPPPTHPAHASHPTINDEFARCVRRGRVRMRADVAAWHGHEVAFVDGSRASYDTVIAATGYVISHPFFAPDLVDYSRGPVPLYLRMIHPRWSNLHFIGLFQPLGCIWTAAELQAKIMARRLAGSWQPPADLDGAIAHELAHPDVRQVDSPRHTITVDGPAFCRRLRAHLPADYVRREPAAEPVA